MKRQKIDSQLMASLFGNNAPENIYRIEFDNQGTVKMKKNRNDVER